MAALLIIYYTNAQNVGIGTTTPNPKALLELSSSSMGFMLPRMDSTTRKNILTPPLGLMVMDASYMAVFCYEGRPSGTGIFNSGSNIVKGATSNYLSTLAPGDKIYFIKDNLETYIGTIQTIISNDSLMLTTNAAFDSTGKIIFSNFTSTAGVQYGPLYRYKPVPWAATNASIYTVRGVERYAAFHSTYISGNVGVDFRKYRLEALQYGRNAQSVQCPPTPGRPCLWHLLQLYRTCR